MTLKQNEISASEESWTPESALDIFIALLYSRGKKGNLGESIEGITRLDKMMFLLSENNLFRLIIKQGYNFEADNFGPFAPELFDDIEALKHENIITILDSRDPVTRSEVADENIVYDSPEDSDPTRTDFSVKRYQLTDEGFVIARLIWNGLTEQQKQDIFQLKMKWQERSLTELLHYVYKRYPKTTEKSKIREKILDSR